MLHVFRVALSCTMPTVGFVAASLSMSVLTTVQSTLNVQGCVLDVYTS